MEFVVLLGGLVLLSLVVSGEGGLICDVWVRVSLVLRADFEWTYCVMLGHDELE